MKGFVRFLAFGRFCSFVLMMGFAIPSFSQPSEPWRKQNEEIIRHTDKRDSKWLVEQWKSDTFQMSERYAWGLGQCGDTLSLDLLHKKLQEARENGNRDEAIAIVKAIGLIGNGASELVLIHHVGNMVKESRPFQNNNCMSQDRYPWPERFYFEALGQCGGEKSLQFLRTIPVDSTYWFAGLFLAYYRLGIRGFKDPETIPKYWKAANHRGSHPVDELFFAHYLARCAGPEIKPHAAKIILQVIQRNTIEVRIPAIAALGKCDAVDVFPFLETLLSNPNSSPQDLVSGIRALSKLQLSQADPLVFELIHHRDPNVATAAGEYFLGRKSWDYANYFPLLLPIANPRGEALFLKASMIEAQNQKAKPEFYARMDAHILKQVEKQSNPYFQAEYHAARFSQPGLLETHEKEMLVYLGRQTAEANLIAQYMLEAWWKQAEREYRPESQSLYVNALKRQFGYKDIAPLTLLAEIAQREDIFHFKQHISDWDFALKWLERLELPKEIEAYYALDDLRAWVKGEKTTPHAKPEWNHPIDLQYLADHPARFAKIETNKGTIKVLLDDDTAPGSTTNFMKLAESGFYDGKKFHRVVPNFVIQGGCPRGDGWGALDYSMRSEVGLPFTRGAIGMASAGKDTEGVQWFITHNITPHLDGRYTCFGYVTEGRDVVQRIEIGDTILSVRMLE